MALSSSGYSVTAPVVAEVDEARHLAILAAGERRRQHQPLNSRPRSDHHRPDHLGLCSLLAESMEYTHSMKRQREHHRILPSGSPPARFCPSLAGDLRSGQLSCTGEHSCRNGVSLSLLQVDRHDTARETSDACLASSMVSQMATNEPQTLILRHACMVPPSYTSPPLIAPTIFSRLC